MAPMLRVTDALCRIGRQSTFSIKSFTLNRGEHWCVFGPNGSGKSLLLKLLSGAMREASLYVTAEAGFDTQRDIYLVSFEEQQRLWQRDNRLDISEYSESAKDEGTTVQALLESARSATDTDQHKIVELLEGLDLLVMRDRGIRYLSSGQVRKVLLARALYGVTGQRGGLLVLDDPLETIDRQSRQKIHAYIAQHLGAGFASLFLCRRAADIPEWTSHLAVMGDLQLLSAGSRDAASVQSLIAELANIRPDLPESLPVASLSVASLSRPERDDDILIALRQVSAAYSGKAVLENINWIVRRGDHVLLEGPNGCGKSTLLSLIDGDNHMGYGQDVSVFGRRKGSGESIWELKAGFGVVSNELHNKYVKGWRVLDVVVSGFYDSVGLYDDSGASEIECARAWLSVMALDGLAKQHYHELSFGQQRLVLLARAMVKEPAILILDEPCVGLDDYHRAMVLGLLDRIAAQTSTQLIYVSHVIGEQLACINRRFQFVPTGSGTYTLVEGALATD